MIKTWKRAITVIDKLESQGLDLNDLMRVMNPEQARRAKKLILAHADITENDLDVIETAMGNLIPANHFVVPRKKKTEMWLERAKNGNQGQA